MNLQQRIVALIILSTGWFAHGAPALNAADEFHGLGALPGDSESFGVSISGNGSVVVGASSPNFFADDPILHAVLWDSSNVVTSLGDLPGGEVYSFATAASFDGSVIVGNSESASGIEAFRWQSPFGMVGLGDLPGGDFSSSAIDVSADGTVLVGQATSAFGREAFRQAFGGVKQPLGDLRDEGEEVFSSALAVSADGSVVAGLADSAEGREAFIWNVRSQKMVSLGDLPGGSRFSSVGDLTPDGTVAIGYSKTFGERNEAFRWTAEDGMQGLGRLGSLAAGVSADGEVIVGRFNAIDSPENIGDDAFIWDQANGMRDLRTVLLNDFGLPVSEWALTVATAISDDGLTIVGVGDNPLGKRQAWRVQVDARWIKGASGSWDDQRNWALGIIPNEMHDLLVTPDNGLIVQGPAASATLKSLTIGAKNNGVATLSMPDGGVVAVNGLTTITSRGKLTGDGLVHALGGIENLGEINLGHGSLQISGGTISNGGLVRGNGTIDSPLVNQSSGEIRVDAGEKLHFTNDAIVENFGRIEAIGTPLELAEIELESRLLNVASDGIVAVRDARVRFQDGVQNSGGMAMSFGTTDVVGDIINTPTGNISIGGGAHVTFYDDILQDGNLIVSKVGGTTSVAVFFGEFSGSGGITGGGDVFMLGDLRPGNSPAEVFFDASLSLGTTSNTEIELAGDEVGDFDRLVVTDTLDLAGSLKVELLDNFSPSLGDEFEILSATNGIAGAFSQITLPSLAGNLDWRVDHAPTSVSLVVIAAEFLAGDYNGNGIVEQADLDMVLLNWGKAGSEIQEDWVNGIVDQDELDAVLLNWGQASIGRANSSVSPVPEASSMVMSLVIGVAGLGWMQRRRTWFK